jgi:hypothetical protein
LQSAGDCDHFNPRNPPGSEAASIDGALMKEVVSITKNRNTILILSPLDPVV